MTISSHPFVISRRQFLQLASAATSLLLLNGCASTPATAQTSAQNTASAADQPQHGGVFRVAFTDSVLTLDPHLAFSVVDVQLAYQAYEHLVRRGENEPGSPLYPELAESWEMSEDALTYTFHLRQGVTFHHGTPFTAKDVEYTLTRLRDPQLGLTAGNTLSDVDQVTVVDDFTVTIQLKTPNVSLPFMLSGYGVQIVPHDRTAEQLAQATTGTGAFYLTEQIAGERVVLKRNENYWNKEAVYLDEVHLLTIPEPATQISALSSGTLDLVYNIGVESLTMLENMPGVAILESTQGIYPLFAMHVTDKPFDDLRVRQAFKHAVDRPALVQALLQGRGMIGNDQPIAPNTPFWADVQPLAYDVEKAKALLAAAGFPNGLEVTLVISEFGGPRVSDAAIALQEMLKAAGIMITLDKVPVNTYYAEKYMQVPFFSSWWPGMSDPNGVLPFGYTADAIFNESGWSDPQLDELIVQARGELDLAARQKAYTQVQAIISEQGGVLIPYFASLLQAARTNVRGYIPGMQVRAQFIWLAQA